MALFAAVWLPTILSVNKISISKTTAQAFEKLCLLAAAKKLAVAGLIFTDYCFFYTYCLVYVGFTVVFTIDTTDYYQKILYT